jgi:NAD(P)-dependent dehydrogenase (short-subunit alcohol dehydrogenase family)
MNTQTAIITGASRGLGLALATALAKKSWNLIINARGKDALETARIELAKHTRVTAISGDISDENHVLELIHVAGKFGGLDLLVNNAGILGPMTRLEQMPINELEHVYKINTLAPLRLIQVAAPILKANPRIINITSDAGIEGYETWGGYGSSKAALEQASRVLANERPDWRVYWVDPGDMRTQMHQEAFPGEDISDRPIPEISIPGILELIEANLPSGRYKAQTMLKVGQ